jgi:hypothetical protein
VVAAVEGHWGLTANLGGARQAYGKAAGSQVIGGGLLQWHIDGAFWQAHPPKATVMRCVYPPPGDATGESDEQLQHVGTLSGSCSPYSPDHVFTPAHAVVYWLARHVWWCVLATVAYGDGATLLCPLGATAFVSAVTAYQLLTEAERERAERTVVQYSE